MRGRLQRSPLLASLPEADLDRLATAARPARFAAGELLIEPDETERDLIVICEGRVEFLLTRDDVTTVTGEAGDGDIVGLHRSTRRDRHAVSVRALTDCEVVIADAEVAGEIASRSAEVATALNRMASIRRRRMERALEPRVIGQLGPSEATGE